MSDAPFIKFFPSDFLGGVGGLSPAERGVYITVLCLIWDNDGPIEYDEARLARRCGAPKAAFKKTIEALIDLGKLHVEDGKIGDSLTIRWDAMSRKLEMRSPIPVSTRSAVFKRDGERCAYCGSTDGPFHLDHVIPWSRGGSSETANLVVACASCNLRKSDRTPEEMGWTLQ